MIYYFSGTGNSKWVAEQIAKQTNDAAKSIPDVLKSNTSVVAAANERIGIVFPIYAWGVPSIVEKFCKTLTIQPGAYAFTVCTCGDEAGKAIRWLKSAFPWQAAWSLAMPNNYIVGFDVDSPELARKKLDLAREKLPQISKEILAKSSAYDVHEGPGAGWKTTMIRPMFNRFARSTSAFSVTSDCNACGLCARICPAEAIQLNNGQPVWVKAQCEQCTGCINRCPQRAIQYGGGTSKRGRYFFRESE